MVKDNRCLEFMNFPDSKPYANDLNFGNNQLNQYSLKWITVQSCGAQLKLQKSKDMNLYSGHLSEKLKAY